LGSAASRARVTRECRIRVTSVRSSEPDSKGYVVQSSAAKDRFRNSQRPPNLGIGNRSSCPFSDLGAQRSRRKCSGRVTGSDAILTGNIVTSKNHAAAAARPPSMVFAIRRRNSVVVRNIVRRRREREKKEAWR
jgi:hypothetical protein